MRKNIPALLAIVAATLVSGCDGGGLTPNQKMQANKQWNDARAGVLASLAADQFRDGSLDKCQTTLDQALRLSPDRVELHLLAARLAIEQDNLESAQQQLGDVHRLDPKNAEAEYLKGVVFQHWHQFEKARAAYMTAVVNNPSELSYVIAAAEMSVAQGRPAEALDLLQKKALVFEHSGVIRDAIGQLLIQQNRYTEGIPELREASMLSVDDPTIREHLAFALLADGQFAEAADCFTKLEKEPEYEKRADIRAAIAECQSQNHLYENARASYLAATELNPSCCGYWLGLAKTAIQLNDLNGAEQAVRRAIASDSSDGSADLLLGYITLKQNRLPEALDAFRAAAHLDPRDSVSVCMQGYVLSKSGRGDDAKLLYARALQINPQDKLAARLEESCAISP